MGKAEMKRVLLVLIALVCVFLLAGCSFQDLMSWGAGVKSDPDYQTWAKLNEKGKLDEEGKYTADAVHITFARNGYLEMHYFSDSDLKNELPSSGCYLLPGDYIYYSAKENYETSGYYTFDHIDVTEYSSENARQRKMDWLTEVNGQAALMIPYDYKGTEVSLEPVGQFGERTFVFSDKKEQNADAKGVWRVNDKENTEETLPGNPLDTYTIQYNYDPSLYYLVSSSPASWKLDDEDGIVIFPLSEAKTGTEKYEVILGSYSSADVSIKNGQIIEILDSENSTTTSVRKNSGAWQVKRVRQNSKITIITDNYNKDNIIINTSTKCDIKDPEPIITLNGGTAYSFEVEFGDLDQFLFIPSQYAYEHGKIKFSFEGIELTENKTLYRGNKINYEAVEVEEGYWLPDYGGEIIVSGSSTDEELRNIKFYPYQKASVVLEQPSFGGDIEYFNGQEKLIGKTVQLYYGTKITAKIHSAEGWELKPEFKNQSEYIVTESKLQTALINGKQVNELFDELEGHKPELTVRINKNLEKCLTTVKTGETKIKEVEFTGGDNFIDAFATIIQKYKLGTNHDLQLVFKNLDFGNNNNALKITIKKETKRGGYIDIVYANTANIPVIIPFDQKKQYTSVNISIEAVKAEAFQTIGPENASLEASFEDMTPDDPENSETISPGTLITGERLIKITYKPHEGYFFTGADTANDIYKKTLKYDEYKNLSIQNLTNQLKKVCTVTLFSEDPYGKVEYFVDDQECSGTIQIREDKEIKITYTVTAEGYEIDTGGDIVKITEGIWNGNVYKTKTVNKKITKEMDGTELTREPEIKVKKVNTNE